MQRGMHFKSGIAFFATVTLFNPHTAPSRMFSAFTSVVLHRFLFALFKLLLGLAHFCNLVKDTITRTAKGLRELVRQFAFFFVLSYVGYHP
jgi:hypothetical protein